MVEEKSGKGTGVIVKKTESRGRIVRRRLGRTIYIEIRRSE